GGISADITDPISEEQIKKSPVYCPDTHASNQMEEALKAAMTSGDSLGAVIECRYMNVPVGLGDPVYEKLSANIAKAMVSIPACKGVEFGSGFLCTQMLGSTHNDIFCINDEGNILTSSNHAGGTLGGISNGMPIIFRVGMKPTSSIKKPQPSISTDKTSCNLTLPENSRHDPCLAIRAVSVVEAMASIAIVDALLMDRLSKL
ncbi:MAG: chorismate synthase, partial [Chlamydiae bacterium]|nr:chorismate synthase [Chlamydiota bacterium]